MSNTVYVLNKDLRLGLVPQIDRESDPEMYDELSDIYNAIQQLAAVCELVGVDVDLERALGNIPNQSVFEKFGRNPAAVAGNDFIGIAGSYAGFPVTAGETMEVLSSSANDTAGGTGVRSVTIGNLRAADGSVVDEVTIAMNGTTGVSLGATVLTRASMIKAVEVGSAGAAVGTINVRHTSTTANVFCTIQPGKTRSELLAYTVPLGYVLAVDLIRFNLVKAGGTAATAQVTLEAKKDGITSTTNAFDEFLAPDISDLVPYERNKGYFLFPALTDIRGHVLSTSSASIIFGELNGVLVKVSG